MTLKSEKTLDLWPRQARSVEARLILYRELNAYRISAVRTELTLIFVLIRVNSVQESGRLTKSERVSLFSSVSLHPPILAQ